MAFQPQAFGQGRFRETLKHEDHIHNQIEACRQAFNRGDLTEIMYTVDALQLLITPAMEDEEFLTELEKQDSDWQKDLKKQEKAYLKRKRAAADGCPDLVHKPAPKPGLDFFKQSFMICCALFERRNLMLKVEKEDAV